MFNGYRILTDYVLTDCLYLSVDFKVIKVIVKKQRVGCESIDILDHNLD